MNSMIKGFVGQQVRIDLTTQETRIAPVPTELARQYLGGSGYGARILFDELVQGADPLGPENIMVLATGPLSLSAIPGGGSITLCFKSPLTGIWGESRVGNNFGPDLKKAGFDHVILTGKSPKPVYVFIEDQKVEFRSAEHLQGLLVSEKCAAIRKELGDEKISILCIGPSGEHLVKFSAVMSDDRAAGRCGGGAVFGSKNLIAVVVKGKTRIEPARPDEYRRLVKAAHDEIKTNPNFVGMQSFGTIGDTLANDDGGDWPTKNWKSNSWGEGPKLYDHYWNNNFIEGFACYRGCTIACARKAHVKEGPYQTPPHGGAEYESFSCFTAYVLNEDADAAIHSTWLCNELGLDTISTGSMIAFAMECFEKGLLLPETLDGLDLSWGNAAVLPVMVRKIAYREGIGDLLAEGVRNAAKKIGQGAEAFAIHVKGLEGPAHDPRSGKALGITYATGNRGMCHIHPAEAMAWDRGKLDWGLQKYGLVDPNQVERWDEAGKGIAVKLLQEGLALPDILGTCKFYMYAGITVDHWAGFVAALTGWNIDGAELLKISERAINLQRMFNVREGIAPKDDCLPERILSRPEFARYSSEEDCVIHTLDAMLQEYYQARGWDPVSGAPLEEKQKELGLI